MLLTGYLEVKHTKRFRRGLEKLMGKKSIKRCEASDAVIGSGNLEMPEARGICHSRHVSPFSQFFDKHALVSEMGHYERGESLLGRIDVSVHMNSKMYIYTSLNILHICNYVCACISFWK